MGVGKPYSFVRMGERKVNTCEGSVGNMHDFIRRILNKLLSGSSRWNKASIDQNNH
jgi:hypothetical protein